VRKSNGNLAASGTLYWSMTPGVVAETDLAGTLKSEYVFFDGERVARRDGATGTAGVFYYFSDHLKTASVITDSAGVIKAESDYYPWGGELQFVNNDSNDYKFTGKKRDIETGLDYFGARYYSNGLGRWVSPDWAAKATSVPYALFSDPQTLNLYSYVRSTPTTRYDVDGHCPDGICIDITKMTQQQLDHQAELTKQVAIGAAKAVGSAAYHAVMSSNPVLQAIDHHVGEPKALQAKNPAQALGKAVTTGAIAVGSVVVGSTASAGTAVSESTSVMHFTSDAGVAGITESGALRAGTYVTTPSEIPAGATSSQVESLLEIGPGKGSNSVTFETPSSNLVVPENGTTTSGGAQQFQLKEPVKVDPSKFKKTGGGD
jgi:RHS repeat-associated protein